MKFCAVAGILSTNSSTVKSPREVLMVAVGFGMGPRVARSLGLDKSAGRAPFARADAAVAGWSPSCGLLFESLKGILPAPHSAHLAQAMLKDLLRTIDLTSADLKYLLNRARKFKE